jgi:hypothetical protein
MSLSPFTPGAVADSVPGRTRLLSDYREAAQRISQLEQFIPRVHVVFGPRGIGKTSLLREGQRILRSAHIRTVWLTAAPGESLLHSLLSELAQLAATGSSRGRRLAKQIGAISLELGNPIVGKVSATVRPSEPASGASSARLIDAICLAMEAVEAEGDSGLGILIDEIQEADEVSLRTIAYAWQELAFADRSTRQVGAALFGVGLPGAPAHINKAVTFSERYQFERLHSLDSEGVREALERPMEKAGVNWEGAALARAIDEAGGYPYKVQLVGDSAWREASRRLGCVALRPGDVITPADVTAGLSRVGEQMEVLHQSRWKVASFKQRQMLVAIARLGGQNVRRAGLAETLGADTRSISVPRQALLDKGIIDANQHGLLSFTVPGFTQFVLARAKEE